MRRFQTVVLGLGAMGSATVCQLAKRGHRILGIDRFTPPHAYGSSHGDTRITRLAIGEGEHYTPLALRSHQLWRELERETGTNLLTVCGELIISSEAKTSISHGERFFANTLAAARKHGIAHEILGATEIRRRFPEFNVRDDEFGYFERDAGFLRPEACVRAQLALARHYGAEIHTGETGLRFAASPVEVTVTTERETYAADTLIVTAGAWLPHLVPPPLARHFTVRRQVLYWFDVERAFSRFVPECFPVFIWELQGKKQGIYGFPAIDGAAGGLKVGTEQYETTTTAETVERNVSDEEIRAMYDEYVAQQIPALGPKCAKTATCLYTMTPDYGFVIDRHPDFARVIVASPCSGHGFKHSAAIGEALAQLAIDGESALDLGACKFARFG